jgi:hypothetical protein
LTLRLFALQAMARDMCARTYPLEDALQFLQLSLSEVTNSNLHVGSGIIISNVHPKSWDPEFQVGLDE